MSGRLGAVTMAVRILADRKKRGEDCRCGETSGHVGWLVCAERLADEFLADGGDGA